MPSFHNSQDSLNYNKHGASIDKNSTSENNNPSSLSNMSSQHEYVDGSSQTKTKLAKAVTLPFQPEHKARLIELFRYF